MVTEAYFNVGKLLTRIFQLEQNTYLTRESVGKIQNSIAKINYEDKSPSSRKEYEDLK